MKSQLWEGFCYVSTSNLIATGQLLVLNQVQQLSFFLVQCFKKLDPQRFFLNLLDRWAGTTGATEVLDTVDSLGDKLIDKFITKTVNGVKYFGCSGGTRPSIQQIKKESLWIQLLEALHQEEAELLDLVKDKKLTSRYKITRANVAEAFPELGLQDEA